MSRFKVQIYYTKYQSLTMTLAEDGTGEASSFQTKRKLLPLTLNHLLLPLKELNVCHHIQLPSVRIYMV